MITYKLNWPTILIGRFSYYITTEISIASIHGLYNRFFTYYKKYKTCSKPVRTKYGINNNRKYS